MKEKIREEKLSLSQKDEFKGNLHNKHKSKLCRSTPNGDFLNCENGFHLKIKEKFKEKFRNNSISCFQNQTNFLQKKNTLQTNNSMFFSNNQTQTQTKINTADFNKEIGFLQDIVCFNLEEEGNSTRSEPFIIYSKNKTKGFTYNFSKILKENKEKINCSFPGAKRNNKNKRQIFVKKFGLSEKKRKRNLTNKSWEIGDGWGSCNSNNANIGNLKMNRSKKIEKTTFYKEEKI